MPYYYGAASWIKTSDQDVMVSHGVISNNSLHLDFNHLFAFLNIKINRILTEAMDVDKTLYFTIHSQFTPLTCYNIKIEGESHYAKATDFDILGDSIICDYKVKHHGYSLDLNTVKNDQYISFYIPILPSDKSDKLTVSYSQHPNPDIKLLWRKTPTSGFQAGHVYQLSIEKNEWEEEILREKEILMEFYHATNGNRWKHNENWGSDEPFHTWYGISTDEGKVKSISLPGNNLSGTIPESLADITNLDWIDLKNNNITGSIPSKLYLKPELINLKLCGNKLNGVLPARPDSEDIETQLDRINNVIYQQDGYQIDLPIYESKDYGSSTNLRILQKHTKGRGIKVIIMGEMYTDRDIESGLYASHVKNAIAAFFEHEPYSSFREYFDIYSLETVSKTNFMGYGTYFDTGYEFERNLFITNSDKVINIVKSIAETGYQTANITTMILMNTTAPFRSNCHTWSDGFAAAFCLYGNKNGSTYLVHHEVCGHGFGKLADEYTEYTGYFPADSHRWLDEDHANNRHMNVDYHNNPNQVVWSHFLTDHRYLSQNLGIFEGGLLYPKGIYRATKNSLMTDATYEFNAPSRQSIYRRIMELSGEKYSLEKFLEYDEINRQRYNNGTVNYSRSGNSEIEDMSNLTAPPVIHRYPASR